MDSQKKSATLPAGMAPPSSGTRGSRGKTPQKLSSHSFSGGFLGRLKRRFRLKSKAYDMPPGHQTAVQGVRFQRHSDELTGQRLKEEGQLRSTAEVARSHSERAERVSPLRSGQKEGRKAASAVLFDSSSAVTQRNCLGKEINIRNDYVTMGDGAIDLETDAACADLEKDVFDDMDPGYETLDEIRRKMQIQFKEPPKMNGDAQLSDAEPLCFRPKGPQHRRSQSTGYPTNQTSHAAEFCPMRDSGLGSPLVSDTSSSVRTSDIVTRESLSIVSDMDISAYQSVNSLGSAPNDNFLSPSNLASMRMNSCPGKTYDLTPGSSQEFLYPGVPNMVYNSDTYLSQGDHVSELYANPKILMRKKSQREENEAKLRLSAHGSDKTLSNVSDEGNINFVASGNMIQVDPKQTVEEVVPPIPERKYSLYLNQQNKRQNSQDRHENIDSSVCSSVLESQCDDSNSATINDNGIFSDHRELADSAITDSVSSRLLNQSVDTCGQDSGFWLSEDDDLVRSYDAPIQDDNSVMDTDKHFKVSSTNQFENDERVILTGDIRTITPFGANEYDQNQGEITGDLYQDPWDVIGDLSRRQMELSSAYILQNQNETSCASLMDQEQTTPFRLDSEIREVNGDDCGHRPLQKQNSSGTRIPYKEMTVCQSASVVKLAGDGMLADLDLCSHRQSSDQKSEHCGSVVSTENVCAQRKSWDDHSNGNHWTYGEHQRISESEFEETACGNGNKFSEVQSVSNECTDSGINTMFGQDTDQQTGQNADQQTGQNADQQTGQNIYQQTGQHTDDQKTGQNADHDLHTGQNTDWQTGQNTDWQTGQNADQQTGQKPDWQTTNIVLDTRNSDHISDISHTVGSSCESCTESRELNQSPSGVVGNTASVVMATSTPDAKLSPNIIERNVVTHSFSERSFESSLESPSVGGSTEPSVDSLDSSTDCLSERSGERRAVSYEDDADAVLENLEEHSDSFVDDLAMSLSGSLSVKYDSNSNSKDSILEESESTDIVTDNDLPSESDRSETLKTDSTEQETESISDPSDDKVSDPSDDRLSSASTLSPASRLPDYYYQDTEPVHMSLSELGMSDEQWPPEPIHMSVNELKRSKSHYEGERERRSHFHTPSPSLWHQSPSRDMVTELPNSDSIQNHSVFPPTQPCSNVYETVDDDDDLDIAPSVNMRNRGHPIMHSAYMNNRGDRPRRPYSAEVPSLHARRDAEFMRRLDSRPPAIIPRLNPDEECQRDFMESMRQLKDCGWYWGPLSWDEAEIKLMNKPDGSFLVRDSSDDRYILSLSFNMQGRVHHTRIEHHKGKFSFWSQPDSHGKATIRDFIEQCVKNSRNGQFLYFIRPSGPGSPPMPVHLLHPISRYKQMQSLQHMCRFQILQKVRRDHIDVLPIPTQMKDYLKDPQYYVEYLGD